jgi:hypothetical protein
MSRGRGRGVREVSAAGDGDGSQEADGCLMLPEVLRPAPGEGIRAGLVIPQGGQVPLGAPVCKDVEKAKTLRVNPARGRHGAGQKGASSARSAGRGVTILRHLGARFGLEELVDIGVAELPVAAHVREVVAAELVGAGNVNDRCAECH